MIEKLHREAKKRSNKAYLLREKAQMRSRGIALAEDSESYSKKQLD